MNCQGLTHNKSNNEKRFEALAESRKLLRCCYVLRQSVPDAKSGNLNNPVFDGVEVRLVH